MGLKRCPGTILGCHSQPLHISGINYLPLEAARCMPDNVFILGHVSAAHELDGFRVVTIKRDPRNVLVSYCRHRKRVDGLDVSIPMALADFWGAPFVATYAGFLGWDGRSIVMRYEDMPSSVTGDGARIYEGQPKDWNTRTGSPSRWQELWDDHAEAAWQSHGGPELLEAAGYS
jgi:hypothetical protein